MSGSESMSSRFQFKEWIDRDAYDIVQPSSNLLGILEAWHVAGMGHLKRKLCCPENWHSGLTIMANAHLVASIPNRLVLEINQTHNPLRTEVFKEPLVVDNGYMDLPDKPGFGMELAPDLEKKFPYIPGRYTMENPFLPK